MAYFKVEIVETHKYTILIEANSKEEAADYAVNNSDWGDPVCDVDDACYVTELVEKKQKKKDIDFDEERVDIVGQNGNNGEHYE
jgi:hypothetical protein